MSEPSTQLQETMETINRAWRSGRVSDMAPCLHPDIIMRLPNSAGIVVGREALMGGFNEFCTNARVIQYAEADIQVDVIGNCGVVSFRFDMLYERQKYREHSTGRDQWFFQRDDGRWLAVWRTMFDLSELREQK